MSEPVEAEVEAPTPRRAAPVRGQFVLLGVGAAVLIVAWAVSAVEAANRPEDLMAMITPLRRATEIDCLAVIIFFVAGVRALWLMARHLDPSVAARNWLGLLASGVLAFVGWLFAIFSLGSFSRGRQLRRFGRSLLPELDAGGDWNALPTAPEIVPELRPQLAAQWRENGRTEHASVAAFARLQLDLVALGAPPKLVRAASEDALDEIRHAELCFSLARALDGRALEPAPFPQVRHARTLPQSRMLALVRLALDSLIEGALLEGFSARVIAKLVRRCADPATRALLRELAADEGRHTRHGWDVLAWCLEEGGAPVADALAGALAALPAAPRSTVPQAAREGAWECAGIAGAQLEARAFAETRAQVVRRASALIASIRARPAA